MSIKEPMHPGKVLSCILNQISSECSSEKCHSISYAENARNILELYDYSVEFISRFMKGEEDIDYVIAYKLGEQIDGTDMAFWLKLQNDYDDYVDSCIEERIDNDMSESISQFNEAREGCRAFGTEYFKAECDSPDKNDKISKLVEIIKDFIMEKCENADCYGYKGFCLNDDYLLKMTKEIIEILEVNPKKDNSESSKDDCVEMTIRVKAREFVEREAIADDKIECFESMINLCNDENNKVDHEFCVIHKNVLDEVLEILEYDDSDHMRIKSCIKKIYDVQGWSIDL